MSDNGQGSAAQLASTTPAPATEPLTGNVPPARNVEPEVQPIENPVNVAFDEKSTQLGEEHRALVERIVAEAGGAS